MDKYTHLIKLSVGSDSPDTMAAWQASRAGLYKDGLYRHVTRMWPRREAELLGGGSIYWVVKGLIQCRQKVLRLEEVTGQDGITRCALVLDPELVLTAATPRRPFQGWRYLAPADAPPDLSAARAAEDRLPPDLASALAEIGVM